MDTTGYFWIYFNRHQAAPLVWSIGLMGTVSFGNGKPKWEIAVKSILIEVPCGAIYAPRVNTQGAVLHSEDDGIPSAYMECRGKLMVDDGGHARIVAV